MFKQKALEQEKNKQNNENESLSNDPNQSNNNGQFSPKGDENS